MRYQLKPEPLPALLRSFLWDAAVSLQSLDRGSCACCGDSGSIALAPAVEVIGLSSHLATWKRMLCSRDLLYRIKPDFVLFSQSALWCGLSTPCFKCAFLEHLPCWVLKGERGVELQCQLFTFWLDSITKKSTWMFYCNLNNFFIVNECIFILLCRCWIWHMENKIFSQECACFLVTFQRIRRHFFSFPHTYDCKLVAKSNVANT